MKHLLALFGAGAVLFTALWWTGIWPKPFQRQRLLIFLGLREDPKKTGYHVTQARIAIGSGGLFGKGFLKGTQVQGGWVPERQTDFIFSDIGEEFGFDEGVAGVHLGLPQRGVARRAHRKLAQLELPPAMEPGRDDSRRAHQFQPGAGCELRRTRH